MLTEVTFEAFRAFQQTTIPLEPLTVFVGPNGSGKTSVLIGIHAALQCISQGSAAVFSNERSLARLENKKARVPFRICARLRQIESSIDIRGTGNQLASFVSFNGTPNHGTTGPLMYFGPTQALAPWANSVFLRLDVRKLGEASYSDREIPILAEDGSGLASVIADLMLRAPERIEAILAALQRVVPSARRIRVARAKVAEEFWGHRVLLDTASGDQIPLDACSEGTVLALGIMTVLHGESAPRTLLIDELDRSLHPKAQEDLIGVLRAAQAADPNLQILATAHSPFLLNALSYEEVRVTTLDDDGFARCASLADHPDLAEWKDSLKPGDWWSAELEDWVKAQAKP